MARITEIYPFNEYMQAWQLYRENSDEDAVTAKHLYRLPSWPMQSDITICDIGCGDGRIVDALFAKVGARSNIKIAEVRLLDPDEECLNRASHAIQCAGRRNRPRVVPTCGTAQEHFLACANGSSIILAIHVVYLMEQGEFEFMLNSCPIDVPLVVIIDAPHSVFTELWQETAKLHHRRAGDALKSISRLPGHFNLNMTHIEAHIKRSVIDDPNKGPWVRSLMCYRNMLKEDVPLELLQYVESVFARHTSEGYINCTSICVEIIRRK